MPVTEHSPTKSEHLRVLVTRPRHQASGFIQLLKQAGAQTFELPCIEIVFKNSQTLSLAQMENARHSDWWIFTSANAVAGAYECGLLAMTNSIVKVAAIGQATCRSLEEYAIPVDLTPVENSNSEQLLPLLKTQIEHGDRVSILRGDSGRELLRNGLKALGAEVHYLEVYRRELPHISTTVAEQILISAMPCVISITSDLVLSNLLLLLPDSVHKQLFDCPVVVNSERCARLAKERGFCNQIQVAYPPGDQGQLIALSTHR